jgi:protein TonB
MKKTFIIILAFCKTILCGQTTNDSTKTFETLPDGTIVYSKADKAADFPGGMAEFAKFIQHNFSSENIHKKKVDGKVFLKFIVLADGTITNISVLKGIEKCIDCENEAIRLIKLSPKWDPAKVNDKPVASYFKFPFKISIK